MPDDADVVYRRAPGPGEAPPPGTAPPDVGEAAQWLAEAPGASEEDLDPALMAWLGPGTCVELATIVTHPPDSGDGAGQEGVSLARALEVAPAVADHVSGCPACSDRLRAMVSVGALLGRGHSSSPDDGHPSGGPATGAAGGEGARRRGSPFALTAGAAALGAGAVAGAIAYLAWPSSSPGTQPSRAAVAAISRLPVGGSSLVLDPVATSGAVLHLSDVGQRAVTWQAATTAPWLRVTPAEGQLAPGQSVSLALDVVGSQASGLRATVTVNGGDGSVTAASYRP